MKSFMQDMEHVYGVQMLSLAFFPYNDNKLHFSK